MALINGREYDFSQIIVNALNVPLVGVTEINYEEEQVKELIFATGTRPVAIGHGPVTATGSIGLLMSEIEKLRKASPIGSLLQLERFDILVIYVNPGGTVGTVTHTLKDVAFTKDSGGGSQGDASLPQTLDIIMSKIEYS